MTIQETSRQLVTQLRVIYDYREAVAICNLVMEKLTSLPRIDRLINNEKLLSKQQQEQLGVYIKALLEHKPVQYVLEEAWFCGLHFFVNEQVLIPRPETEELVRWIIDAASLPGDGVKLLDIGTGSGCIAVALKKALTAAEVWAIDISKGAMSIAARNAATSNADIQLIEGDITVESVWKLLPEVNIIVSNPPYVRHSETASMLSNVVKYEPHEALFVKDDDALLFYRKIANLGRQHLFEGGMLFFEINEMQGADVMALLQKNGYTDIQLRKDLQQKDRMIKAIWPG